MKHGYLQAISKLKLGFFLLNKRRKKKTTKKLNFEKCLKF